jgi:hypothetical protein
MKNDAEELRLDGREEFGRALFIPIAVETAGNALAA